MRRRWLVIGITIGLFALSIVGMSKVQKQFFPNSTRLELNVELRLPEGASIAAIDAEARHLEAWLEKDKAEFDQFEHYIAYIGSGSPRYYLGLDQQLASSNVSQFVIVTRDVKAREALRERLDRASTTAKPSAPGPPITRIENGPPVGYPVQYRIPATTPTMLRKTAGEIAERHAPGARTVQHQSGLERAVQDRSKSRSTRTRPACSAFPARTSPPCSTCR